MKYTSLSPFRSTDTRRCFLAQSNIQMCAEIKRCCFVSVILVIVLTSLQLYQGRNIHRPQVSWRTRTFRNSCVHNNLLLERRETHAWYPCKPCSGSTSSEVWTCCEIKSTGAASARRTTSARQRLACDDKNEFPADVSRKTILAKLGNSWSGAPPATRFSTRYRASFVVEATRLKTGWISEHGARKQSL